MNYASLITGWGFGLALFYCCSAIKPAQADVELFTHFDTHLVSEFEPLDTAIGDWGTAMEDGERQWVLGRFEVGARYSGFEISVQQRALADLRINEDAVKFYSRVAAELPLTPGESVPVDIRINGFSAQGLRLGYRGEIADVTIAAGVTWLKTSHLMTGGLTGQFAALSEDQYSVDAAVDYLYYRDIVFKRENINTARGEGAAFDLRLAWQPTANWYLDAHAEDLFTEIRWKDAPFTIATANTNRKSYGEDGYAFFNPLFSGRQGYRDSFTQKIDPRYRLNSRYQWNSWSLHFEGQHQFGYEFAGIGAGFATRGGSRYKLMVWPTEDTLGFEINSGKWHSGLRFDDVSWSEMKSLSLTISYNFDVTR